MVGSLGVWTVSAGADETADPPPAPAAAEVEAESGIATPPPLLPWGAKPSPPDVGPADATSAELAAVGADVAAPVRTNKFRQRGKYSPKGFTSKKRTRTKAVTTAPPVAPQPPGVQAAPEPGKFSVNFHYATARQEVESYGTYANMYIGTPYLNERDYHSLSEISLHSADGKHIIEVGWTVDRAVNKDKDGVSSDDPHLFVYHWVDNKETCYNGCGFVENPKALTKVGSKLPSDVIRAFGIQKFGDNWWIIYNSEYIGYFPGSLFRDEFDRSGLIQWFGEVASSRDATCTDMGNGEEASPNDDPRSAKFTHITLIGKDGSSSGANISVRSNGPAANKGKPVYSSLQVNPFNFRFGGPGILSSGEEAKPGIAKGC